MNGKIIVCGGRSHPQLVNQVSRYLSVDPTKINFVDFSNGNMKVQVGDDVRDADVFVIQSGARGGVDNRFYDLSRDQQHMILAAFRGTIGGLPPELQFAGGSLLDVLQAHFNHLASFLCNRDFVELLMIVDALKTSSAGRITVVMPYMFYVRSDKKDEGRISVTAKMVAKLLEKVGAHRVLVMDLHAEQEQSFFDLPTDQIFADPLMFQYIHESGLRDCVVVTADENNNKPLHKIARSLGDIPVVIIHKKRVDDTENPEVWGVSGDVSPAGKTCLVWDDELLTGRTLEEGMSALFKMGAKAIYVFIRHFIASNAALEMIERMPITKLVTTSSVSFEGELPPKIVVIDAAPLLARAIRCIHESESMSRLIESLRERSLRGKLDL